MVKKLRRIHVLGGSGSLFFMNPTPCFRRVRIYVFYEFCINSFFLQIKKMSFWESQKILYQNGFSAVHGSREFNAHDDVFADKNGAAMGG